MTVDADDVGLLVALGALLEERHVTRAAHRLGVTQSTMSTNLRRLRERFGDPLLVRSSNAHRLTPLAESILPGVLEALRAAGTVFSTSGFDPATSDQHFRVAISEFAQVCVGAEFARILRNEAPSVRVSFVSLNGRFADIERTARDFDLVVLPWAAPDASVVEAPLFSDRLVGVLDAAHPALRTGTRPGDALADAPFVSAVPFAGDVAPPPLGDDLREFAGLGTSPPVLTLSYFAAGQVIRGTEMWCLLPERLATMPGFAAGTVVLPIDAPSSQAAFTENLVWHESRHSDPGTTWLRGALGRAGAALPAV